tara:strand:+ start:112238 stop:112342 length:105 start_codon:yes stop_codon:yes gene_type:complete
MRKKEGENSGKTQVLWPLKTARMQQLKPYFKASR